jgi:hypothetical protein
MGHNLHALIARQPIFENKASELGLAVVFENDLVIIPIVPESLDVLERELGLKFEPYSEKILVDCSVTHRLAELLGIGSFAVIQTEYFGGSGTQFASYYRNGSMELGEVTVNDVLRQMGVGKAVDKFDEFDTIGLGKYRRTDDDRFWEEESWGHRIGNILVGKKRFAYD